MQADDADGRTWTVLLDLGNGALGALQRFGDPTALDAIGLSHLHADHVADMAVLTYCAGTPGRPVPPVPCYGPAGTAERLGQPYGPRDEHGPSSSPSRSGPWGRPCVVGPLALAPVPVEHPIPAFGIRVTGPSDAPARP